MSALTELDTCPALPLVDAADPQRAFAWHRGRVISVGEFLRDVAALAARQSPQHYRINLCEDRYGFLVGFGAALSHAQTTLLPASRAPAKIDELKATYPESGLCTDADVDRALEASESAVEPAHRVPGEFAAVVGFTSGSTGQPRPHVKRWNSFAASSALNLDLIRACLAARGCSGTPFVVATVPPQHMYGMETSVLLPLFGAVAVHSGRPLFPADIVAALAEVPEPRILVSTPIHLRALVDCGLTFPPVALVLSATAPLDADLARRVEATLDTELREVFGSTETCVIASRRTARDPAWELFDGVELIPEPDGTRVEAPWMVPQTVLQDVVELLPGHRFALRGRNVDMIEIAGKRASLAELTRRLLAVPGVRDAVVCQPDAVADGAVRRVAALVVAPEVSREEILRQLRDGVDPAFLPRPLVLVDALPRNEVGKISREQLLAALGKL